MTTSKTLIPTPHPPSEDFFSSAFLMGNVGAPFILGMAVGYFAKKMLRVAFFIAGGAVALLFAAEYYGVVNISDADLQHAATSATDAAKSSGDFLVHRLTQVTSKGVSGAAGFFAGFKVG